MLDTGLGYLRTPWLHRQGCNSLHVADFAKGRLDYAERHEVWRREWKFALIEADNPDWLDLWEGWHADCGVDLDGGR